MPLQIAPRPFLTTMSEGKSLGPLVGIGRQRRHTPNRNWTPTSSGILNNVRAPPALLSNFNLERLPAHLYNSSFGTQLGRQCGPPTMQDITHSRDTFAPEKALEQFLPDTGDHVRTTWNTDVPIETSSTDSDAEISRPAELTWLAQVTEVCAEGAGRASGKILWALNGYPSGTAPTVDGSWDVFEGSETKVKFRVSPRDGVPYRELKLLSPSEDWIEWNPVVLSRLQRGATMDWQRTRHRDVIESRQEANERELRELRGKVLNMEMTLAHWVTMQNSADREKTRFTVTRKDVRNGIIPAHVPDIVRSLQANFPREYMRAIDKAPSVRSDAFRASKMTLGDASGLDVVMASAIQLPSPGAPIPGVSCLLKEFQALADFFLTDKSVKHQGHATEWQATVRPTHDSLPWAAPDDEFALQFASYGSFCDALNICKSKRKFRLWSEFLGGCEIPSVCLVGSVIVIKPESTQQPEENVHLQRLVLLGFSLNALMAGFKDGVRDHDVSYLRQVDIRYKAGARCCNSEFTRTTCKVSDLMRLLDSSTIIAEDHQDPMEIVWRPIPQYEKGLVQTNSEFTPGLLTCSVPVVLVRSDDLMKSATRLCDPDAHGDGRPVEVHGSRLHRQAVQEVVDAVTRAPNFVNPPATDSRE